MNSTIEVIQAISIGLFVANFLLKTCRVLKAIDLCKECLIFLNNKAVKTEELIQIACKGLYWTMSEAYCLIKDYSSAIKYGRKLLVIAHKRGDEVHESRVTLKLAVMYQQQGKYEEAIQFCEKALEINAGIGDRVLEASCYGHLGTLFQSLAEYAKATKCTEKALAIIKEIGDRNRESSCYGNLGNVFYCLSEYGKAKEYMEKAAAIKKDIGEKYGEASSYGNLGVVHLCLGEFLKAKEYHEKALAIRQEIGDKQGEGADYGNLGNVFQSLGEYVSAKDHLEKALKITKEIGDRNGEASCYGTLGILFLSLCEHVKAKDYFEKALALRKEIGDRDGEGTENGNLGTVFKHLGEYFKAKEHFEKALKIKQETGARNGEAAAYGNLGTVFQFLGEYVKAKDFQEKALAIKKEIGDKSGVASSYGNLGNYENLGIVFVYLGEYANAQEYLEKALAMSQEIGDVENQFLLLCTFVWLKVLEGKIKEAFTYLLSSMHDFENLRHFIGDNDQFKISFSEQHVFPFWLLSAMFRGAGAPRQALYVAELGRARALADLMSAQYSVENQISADPQSWVGIERIMTKESNCNCLYIYYTSQSIALWILKGNGVMHFHEMKINENTVYRGLVSNLDDFLDESFRQFGRNLPKERCEDRSLNGNTPTLATCQEDGQASFRLVEEEEDQSKNRVPSLSLCYKMIIAPVADLLEEPEIVIVPDRSLYKVPFAALPDERGKHLSETFRIRIVPSLTTLKLIQDSPADYHSQTGALIVGDPDVGLVRYKGKKKNISRLPCAGNEAAMIGRLLGVQPLLGEQATKQEVLDRINSVSLIHFAAHGDAERGEIALSPPRPINKIPVEEEYLLTMSDISRVQLRAKLVVLSCCHSGKGEIKVEGVVGIARAFLASGARSVLVALWALEDSATEQMMKSFYRHLVRGESASESLHEAMKWMRANGYNHIRQWAPFMLIGDNVTFNFEK
ncbi:tetratricopeptide repeat protein 28-like [Oculina patagonica]